jgi:hypothetical protein
MNSNKKGLIGARPYLITAADVVISYVLFSLLFPVGENVIRFTPDKAGVYPYSCWMGMITSSITVLDPGSAAGGNEAVTTTAGKSSPDAAAQAPVPASRGSCCAPGAAAGQAPDTTGATSQGFCYAPGADAGQAPDSADSTALGSCCGQ